jgi:hypothetical protein
MLRHYKQEGKLKLLSQSVNQSEQLRISRRELLV